MQIFKCPQLPNRLPDLQALTSGWQLLISLSFPTISRPNAKCHRLQLFLTTLRLFELGNIQTESVLLMHIKF